MTVKQLTGLKVGFDRIIEIGAVAYVKELPDLEFETLCNSERQIAPKAQEMTGLTNHDLKESLV